MIKAIFLLMVFSLNTLAGFACSLGLDMGYNSEHHKHDKHEHQKGHKHEAGHSHKHSHSSEYSSLSYKVSNSSDDCCTNQVNSFAQLDKSIAQNNLLLKVPVYHISSVPWFSIVEKHATESSVNSRFQFVRRSCSLDDTDIRIAIQSFQI